METTMLSPDRVPDLAPLQDAAADYATVQRAIAYITQHWRGQPEIEAIAAAVSVTDTELNDLFRRWAGLTPKAFLRRSRSIMRANCFGIPRACSTRPSRSACQAPAACMTCSSRMKRCRRRMENRGRRSHRALRLPPVAVRASADHADRARVMRACLRRRG